MASLRRRERPRVLLHLCCCIPAEAFACCALLGENLHLYRVLQLERCCFQVHQARIEPVSPMLKTVTLPSTTGNIVEMLCSQLATQRLERRQCLLKILSNVRFLARQGLAFRGDGDESDSNFMRLLNLRSEDHSKLVEWVQQKTDN